METPFEDVGHIPFDDPQGQSLDHRRLADPGLADDDGVVLSSPGQDVDHLADLPVAAEDGVDLPGRGLLGEIGAETGQGRAVSPGAACLLQPLLSGGDGCSIGTLHDLPELRQKGLPADGAEKIHIAAGAELDGFGQEGQKKSARPDPILLEINGGDQPGLLEPFQEEREKRRVFRHCPSGTPRWSGPPLSSPGPGRDRTGEG